MTVFKANRIKTILYYMGAICMPAILLFNAYNRQDDNIHIVFAHIVILACMLSLTGVVMFFVVKRFVGFEESLILCMLFWAGFWFYTTLRRSVFANISGFILLLLIAAVLVMALVLLIKFKPPLKDFSPVFSTISAVFVAMLLINAMPAFYQNVPRLESADAASTGSHGDVRIRRSFNVNHDLPMPDIYWIHLDGMVNLETFEYFWGICQQNTRNELDARGFLIYNDAYIRNAAGTHVVMPMILSPSVFDNFIVEILEGDEEGFRDIVNPKLHSGLRAIGISRHDIYAYFELQVALLYRGYRIRGFNDWWSVLDVERIFGDERRSLSRMWSEFAMSDLPHFIYLTTPIPIGWIVSPHVTIVYRYSPEIAQRADFTWIYYNCTHPHAWHRFDPRFDRDCEASIIAIDLYPLAFESILSKMFESIDTIQARNPNAVIILQSDHGIHIPATQQYLYESGVPWETLLMLFNSVFSAVYFPDGGVSEPVHPLNITRVLVNRYVGNNYVLLEID